MIVLTYNILNPFHAVEFKTPQGFTVDKDGNEKDNWIERCPKLIRNMQVYDFDIACIQELNSETKDFFNGGYKTAVYDEHKNKVLERIHGNSIVYNPRKLQPIESHTVRTKDLKYRAAPCALFKDKKSRLIAVLSVHLKGYDGDETDPEKKLEIKLRGYNELVEYVDQLESVSADVYVIAGDFNEHSSEMICPLSRQQLLIDRGYVYDGDLSPTEHGTGRKIDWIFVKSRCDLKIGRINKKLPFEQASDHLPHASVIEC